LIRGLAVPNPQYGPGLRLGFKLRGRAELLRVTAFSPGYVKEGVWEVRGSYRSGWNQAVAPAALPCGLHYLKLEAGGPAGTAALKETLKVVVLR
jgi:hypothetical protein